MRETDDGCEVGWGGVGGGGGGGWRKQEGGKDKK